MLPNRPITSSELDRRRLARTRAAKCDTHQLVMDGYFPHAKPLVFVAEAARCLAISPDQVRDLSDAGVLHVLSISDSEAPKRDHVRITRLSVIHKCEGKPAPTLADYGISPDGVQRQAGWCFNTEKKFLRLDEVATHLRCHTRHVRDLLPIICGLGSTRVPRVGSGVSPELPGAISISDAQNAQRQHYRISTAAAATFVNQRLTQRNNLE